jgi:hypothetical protein
MNSVIKSISIILLILNYAYSIVISSNFEIFSLNSDTFPSQEKNFYFSNCNQNLVGFLIKNENLIVNIINDLKHSTKKIINPGDFPVQLERSFKIRYSLYTYRVNLQIIQPTVSEIIFPFHYFW